MFIPKVTCFACKIPLKAHKNDVTVQVNSSFGPYYKIAADVWRCPSCLTRIIMGYAEEPIAMNHEENFQRHYWDEEVNL